MGYVRWLREGRGRVRIVADITAVVFLLLGVVLLALLLTDLVKRWRK